MAEPCVADTETLDLSTTGTPAVLTGEVKNVSKTFSATQGDNTLHVVTDAAVPHVQTRTVNVPNVLALSAVTGILVAAFAPIVLGAGALASEFDWLAELIIDSVLQDSASGSVNLAASADFTDADAYLCVFPSLLGQIDIVAGGTTPVTFRKTITNNGPSTTWSFIMNGDKIVTAVGP